MPDPEFPLRSVLNFSPPLAWNMPNPASEIVRPSYTTSSQLSKAPQAPHFSRRRTCIVSGK